MYISALAAYNPTVSSAAAAFAQPLFTSQQPVSSSSPSYQAQISDYGKIQNTLAELQAAAQNLTSPESFAAVTGNATVPATLNAAENNALSGEGATRMPPGDPQSQLSSGVRAFVAAYNRIQVAIGQHQQGDLMGEPTLNSIKDQLLAALDAQKNALIRIGITSNNDGTLNLNPQALQNALMRDPAQVARIFTDAGAGLADRIASREQESNRAPANSPSAQYGAMARGFR